ncbi:MAG: zinc ribbon domain-containing protein [Deltaproteobacteria bacterium]|nr:zinc ribbon domain-containing protein [Deltaproteobacteria bacterium]
MPVYEYEHTEHPCSIGRIFEVTQSLKERPLSKCPQCGCPVKKLISLVGVSTPKTNSELRDLGFTKLVKRDDGIYENVTARNGDSRYMKRGKPETVPNVTKIMTN